MFSEQIVAKLNGYCQECSGHNGDTCQNYSESGIYSTFLRVLRRRSLCTLTALSPWQGVLLATRRGGLGRHSCLGAQGWVRVYRPPSVCLCTTTPTGGQYWSTVFNLSILCSFVDPIHFRRNAYLEPTPTCGLRLFQHIYRVERKGFLSKNMRGSINSMSADGVSAVLYRIRFRTIIKIRIRNSAGNALFK